VGAALRSRAGGIRLDRRIRVRGVETASILGDEIRDARRTLPRAILIAGALITGAYLLGTLAVIAALPPGEARALDGIAAALAGPGASGMPWLGTAGALLVAFGTLGGAACGWPRLAAAVRGRADRHLPPVFAGAPRWGTRSSHCWCRRAAPLFVVWSQSARAFRPLCRANSMS